jgi:hypothetical protein
MKQKWVDITLVATIPALIFAVVGTLDEVGWLSLDCISCGYPGFTPWGYLESSLMPFLILSPIFLTFHFWNGLNWSKRGVLIASEVILYGYALVIFAGRLSTTQPLALGFYAQISILPVGLVWLVGNLLVKT